MKRKSRSATVILAVTLTGIAGYVDAFGYLTLNHVYVANMSGNSVALGIHVAQLEWSQAVQHGRPIISFLCGLLISRFIVSFGIHKSFRFVAASALSIQFLMLLAFTVWHSGPVGVFLAGCAMGIQAATVSRFNGVTIYTCFVTGTLVKFADNIAEMAASRTVSHESIQNAMWFAGVWSMYIGGAVAGTWELHVLRSTAMWIPLAALALLIALDLRRPTIFDDDPRAN